MDADGGVVGRLFVSPDGNRYAPWQGGSAAERRAIFRKDACGQQATIHGITAKLIRFLEMGEGRYLPLIL